MVGPPAAGAARDRPNAPAGLCASQAKALLVHCTCGPLPFQAAMHLAVSTEAAEGPLRVVCLRSPCMSQPSTAFTARVLGAGRALVWHPVQPGYREGKGS